MALTNFPGGLTSFGMPVVGSGVLPVTAGNYWFVSSTLGSNGNDGSMATPYATLAYVLANKVAVDDVVVLLPKHAEAVIAAGGITANVAGVRIVGIGNGADRPTFTFSTSTAASFLISAASVSVTNVVGVAGINALSQPFDVRASDCTLNIEWQDGTAAVEALRAVLTTAAASRLNINMTYRGFTAGSSGVNAIRLVGVAGARIFIDYYGICTTAVVEFATTLCTNVDVTGTFYVSGTTNFSKNVVDTITGSLWYVNAWDAAAGKAFDGGSAIAVGGSDVATVLSNMAVPSADAVTNALERDVIGNKSDASVTTVATTKSLMAYLKGTINWLTVAALDSAANASVADVQGNKTDTSVYVPGTTKSLAAYVKGHADLQERVALSATAAMVNGNTVFTVAGGPIEIMALVSVCVTGNNATASTLQYSVTPTIGSATTISGASASLASALAGASVALAGTALATAALLSATGPNLMANPGTIYCPAGTITMVVAVGSTTGTWQHFIRYKPLATGVSVS